MATIVETVYKLLFGTFPIRLDPEVAGVGARNLVQAGSCAVHVSLTPVA